MRRLGDFRDIFPEWLKFGAFISISFLSACGGGSSGPSDNPLSPVHFTIGGTTKGLAGTGLILQLNGGDDIQQTTNGAFTFSATLASGSAFTVTVKTQPNHPSQTCSVTNGSGTVGQSAVASIAVNCSTNSYTLGGTVDGLEGTGLILKNVDGSTVAVAGNGVFKFGRSIDSGDLYSISVATQPSGPGQKCTVTDASATIGDHDVSTVQVHCAVVHFSSVILDLAGVDEIWDPRTDRLYVSLEPSGGASSAAIAIVNPVTGQVESTVSTSSLAYPIVLSDDGHYLYAGLESSGEIQRYTLPGLRPDIRFTVGVDSAGVPFRPSDIAVQPGHPGTIAVAREFGSSYARNGIAIFDDAVPRPMIGGSLGRLGIGGVGALWNDEGTRVFSFDTPTGLVAGGACMYINHIAATGVVGSDCIEYVGVAAPFGTYYNAPHRDLQISANRIYSNSGVVYDTQSNTVIGSFRTSGQSEAVDVDSHKAHFASAQTDGTLVFEMFNLSRMTLIERNSISENVGAVRRLVRWGKFGLAATTDAHKLILTSGTFVSDVAATDISLDGTPTQDGASTVGHHQYRTLAIRANQLAWSPRQSLLYASVSGDDPKYGNSVVAMDVSEGLVKSAVPVGSEPSWLALTDESTKLWVGHTDTSRHYRISFDSMSKDLETPLFGGGLNQTFPAFAVVMGPQPGSNTTIAVAASPANANSVRTVVFDDGSSRMQSFAMPVSGLAWGPSTALYAASGSRGFCCSSHLYTFQVSGSGLAVALDDTGFGSGDQLHYAGGLLYDNLMRAYNPVSKSDAGAPSAGHGYSGSVLSAIDPARDRAYVTGINLAHIAVVDVYQLSTLALIDSIEFPSSIGSPKSIVSLGTQGLAIATADGHIVVTTGGML